VSVLVVVKESERGAVMTSGLSTASDAAVGQLIDFDTDTPSSGLTNNLANMCMLNNLAFIVTVSSYHVKSVSAFYVIFVCLLCPLQPGHKYGLSVTRYASFTYVGYFSKEFCTD